MFLDRFRDPVLLPAVRASVVSTPDITLVRDESMATRGILTNRLRMPILAKCDLATRRTVDVIPLIPISPFCDSIIFEQ